MMLQFAEFGPDRSAYDSRFSSDILNVLPKADGYGPMPSFTAYSDALAAAPKGAFRTTNAAGDVYTFAGTSTKLYQLNSGTLAWSDVTRTVGGNYTLPTDTLWSFAKFGEVVIAVQQGDQPQYFIMGTSTNFEDIAAAPRSGVVSVVGNFVLMSNINSSTRRSQWSGLENYVFWTPRQQSSDFQDHPDGGKVMGHASFDKGAVIFQEESIREMNAAFESPAIFTFRKTEENRGCYASGSIVQAGRAIFFLSRDGFYQYGEPSTPIGNARVDEWFLSTVDRAALHLVQGMDDPDRKIAFWRFKSTSHTSTLTTDKMLAYHYGVNKWSVINQELSILAPFSSAGYTLDGLDTLGIPLDSMTTPLDSATYQGGAKYLAGFDSSYRLGFFSGTAMEAQVDTADVNLNEGARAYVNGFRPISDATPVYGAVAGMDLHSSTKTWDSETAMNANGVIPARRNSRLHRFRLRIPSGTAWQDLHGIEPEVRAAGQQ